MKAVEIVKNLNEQEFYIDSIGRLVIQSEALMREITGASGGHAMAGTNGACLNVNC